MSDEYTPGQPGLVTSPLSAQSSSTEPPHETCTANDYWKSVGYLIFRLEARLKEASAETNISDILRFDDLFQLLSGSVGSALSFSTIYGKSFFDHAGSKLNSPNGQHMITAAAVCSCLADTFDFGNLAYQNLLATFWGLTGLFHDSGKLYGEVWEIVNNPGADPSDQEWKTIMKHPELGVFDYLNSYPAINITPSLLICAQILMHQKWYNPEKATRANNPNRTYSYPSRERILEIVSTLGKTNDPLFSAFNNFSFDERERVFVLKLLGGSESEESPLLYLMAMIDVFTTITFRSSETRGKGHDVIGFYDAILQVERDFNEGHFPQGLFPVFVKLVSRLYEEEVNENLMPFIHKNNVWLTSILEEYSRLLHPLDLRRSYNPQGSTSFVQAFGGVGS